MSAITSKVIYFTAGAVPTAPELAAIQRLETVFQEVYVRNAETVADTLYGSRIESSDFVAGNVIPAAYSGVTEITVPSDVAPDAFVVFPAAISIDASDADISQLAAVKATISVSTGLAVMEDLAADATVVWASSNEAVATVGGDGLVTAVGAGSCEVTATLTAEAAVTGGAIEADDDIYTKEDHGFVTGQQVRLVSLTGGTGLTAGNDYFFHKLDDDTGYLCSSYANSVAGTAVNVTVDGTSVVLSRTPQAATCDVTVAS